MYTVAGSSGLTSPGAFDHPVMIESLEVLGSLVLDIAGHRMDLTFLDAAGSVRDHFTMLRNCAAGDGDQDGHCTGSDNCPDDTHPDQADADEDGIGDVCEVPGDDDGDGVGDGADNCPQVPYPGQANGDNDSFGDVCDNCPGVNNQGQGDFDGDGVGNHVVPVGVELVQVRHRRGDRGRV